MTVLCAMLYALLTAADYWLRGGSLLRFGLLAVVMIATRRIVYGVTAPGSAARGHLGRNLSGARGAFPLR